MWRDLSGRKGGGFSLIWCQKMKAPRNYSEASEVCLVRDTFVWRQGREGLMGKRETCGAKDCAPGRPERHSTNELDVSHLKRNYAQKGEELGRDRKSTWWERWKSYAGGGGMQWEVWGQPEGASSTGGKLVPEELQSESPRRSKKTAEGPRKRRRQLHNCYTKVWCHKTAAPTT